MDIRNVYTHRGVVQRVYQRNTDTLDPRQYGELRGDYRYDLSNDHGRTWRTIGIISATEVERLMGNPPTEWGLVREFVRKVAPTETGKD